MKKIAMAISFLALLLLIAAPTLFYMGKISLEINKNLLLVATIVWFATAILWMDRPDKSVGE